MNIITWSISITPSGTSVQHLSATASFLLHHTTTSYRHENNAVVDDCFAGGHLGPWIIGPLLGAVTKE